METVRKEFTFASVSGLGDIYAVSLIPKETDIRGVFQITHGMAEHTARYEAFAEALCARGYAVYMHDHIGHGRSAQSDDALGFFGEAEGYRALVEDVKVLTDIIKKEQPSKKIILFGHSMGSFVARSYCEKYGNDIDAAVFCGTAGANPGALIGKKVADAVARRNGSRFRSEFINSLAFSSYNKRIKPARTPFDWLTRDEEIVDAYIADPKCGFLFTATGYRDLFTLLASVNKRTWYAGVPYPLPILLIAGSEDPVGAYGKGPKEVVKLLRDTNHNHVTLKLYPDCRHEILNEFGKETVYKDVADWADEAISKPEVL